MDVLDFWKNYELIATTNNLPSSQLAEKKKCRFCGKTEDQVDFMTVTHIIPELLGRNNITSFDECDECNNKFSANESHLATFLRPYLTMFAVSGKNGIPAFHSRTIERDENTRTKIKVTKEFNRQIELGTLDDYQIDEKTKTVSITFRKGPYRPKSVYKSLVKIGLSLLPDNFVFEYNETFNWLVQRECSVDTFVAGFLTVITYKKFQEPFADLYRAIMVEKEDTFIPDLTLIVGCANVVIQIFLPSSKTIGIQKTCELNYYPAFVFDDIEKKNQIAFTGIELGDNNTISTNQTLHFKYQDADLNIHKKHT